MIRLKGEILQHGDNESLVWEKFYTGNNKILFFILLNL